MNTKDIGERTEAVVIAALLKAGKTVLIPFGDNQRYDLVIEDSGKFDRVQCKTGRNYKRSGVIEFDCCSSYVHRGRGKRDYRGDVDIFGVYYPDNEKIYLVPVEEVGVAQCTLRLEPPKNNQKSGIRYAKDYELK